MANLKRLSKFLALILRHKPGDFGLVLDSEGFTDLAMVWTIVEKRYPESYSRADLATVVAGDQNGKKRYEIRGDKIRALYGHGQINAIEYPSAEPPEYLYHGTNPEALKAIRKDGLQSQGRQYVHLTTSLKIAQNIASRRTQNLIILIVHAAAAHRAGCLFHHPEAEHYLTRAVPPEFIKFPHT